MPASNLPDYFTSPLKPSNATLELENGETNEVPSHLTKATPNFHLAMPAFEEGFEFCKTTLSAMILNYPPPTIVGLNENFGSETEKEKARLTEILGYLTKDKLVNDDDMMLIVDGRDTWFQLPSDVLIRQYQNVLEDANKRLRRLYGNLFQQTIVFGATKVCQNDEVACHHMPELMLPANIYGRDTGKETRTSPARYLDSTMLMGPVKDLKVLYEEAVRTFQEGRSESATVQSVMATVFAKQQMARNKHKRQYTMTQLTHNFFDWAGMSPPMMKPPAHKDKESLLMLENNHHHEMMVGLDYAHTLFQPLEHCANEELIPLLHDTSVDLSKHHHPGTPTRPLALPAALHDSVPPYWTPNTTQNNPSPNEHAVHIEHLNFDPHIDALRDPDTPWSSTPLVQNTYTGTVPATFRIDDSESSPILGLTTDAHGFRFPPPSNISWNSFWYAGYERALLRNYFRIPQSSVGYHNVAVGGDRLWDQRGGRGGVWTAKEGLWFPWGEVDGVCGSLEMLKRVFADGKGVWLHEGDGEQGEQDRVEDERKFLEEVEKKKAKEEEKKKEEEERKKAEEDEKKIAEEDKTNEKEEEEKQKEAEGKVEEDAQAQSEDNKIEPEVSTEPTSASSDDASIAKAEQSDIAPDPQQTDASETTSDPAVTENPSFLHPIATSSTEPDTDGTSQHQDQGTEKEKEASSSHTNHLTPQDGSKENHDAKAGAAEGGQDDGNTEGERLEKELEKAEEEADRKSGVSVRRI